MQVRRTRAGCAGLIAAVGALVAHLAAGGSVEAAPGLVVLATVLPASLLLVRPDAVAPVRLFALAALAQLVGHLALLMAPGGHADHAVGHHAGPALLPTGTMLAGHLAVALLVAALASGADRAILGLISGLVTRLLPPATGALDLPAGVRLWSRHPDRVRRHAGAHRIPPGRGPPWARSLLLPLPSH